MDGSTCLYVKQTNCGNLPGSTGNQSQCLVITQSGKEAEKQRIRIAVLHTRN